MIFALLIICLPAGCDAFTYDEAPYEARETCFEAHERRRPLIFMAYRGARVREVCTDLKSIRRLSPDAYPDHAIEESV